MTSSATVQETRTARTDRTTRALVVGGLGVGAVLGFGGNFVEQGAVQDLLYAVSAVGLILAATLLALQHAGAGSRLPAAGFVLLALGESRILSPTDVPGGEASFAAGVMLYGPALLLVAASSWAPLWVRVAGAAAAVVFATHALIFFGGGAVDSTGPLAGIGYTLLTVTIIGWIFTTLRSPVAPSRAG